MNRRPQKHSQDRFRKTEGRPAREGNNHRFSSNERTEGRFNNEGRRNNEEGGRRFKSDDRSDRRFGRDGKQPRREGGDRRFNSSDRSEGRFNKDERKPNREGRDRRFKSDDRSDRRFNRDERQPKREGGDRRFKTNDRSDRKFDREERRSNREGEGRRFKSHDRSEGRYSRDERQPNREGRDRRFKSNDRPNRRFGRNEESSNRVGGDRPTLSDDNLQKQLNTENKDKGSGKKDPNTLRLNKFISNAGVCSRRDADELIKNGEITVNGEVITQLGSVVSIDDDVRYLGKKLSAEQKVYLLLNKPKDVVTTIDDPHAKITVMDILGDACEERIYPVGRLDRMTTGLLLFTNDGDLAKQLTHPKHQCKKIYHAHLDKNVEKGHLEQIAEGITLEDGTIHADTISYVDNDKTQVGIEIHSGRNRIVRRIFEHFGYNVEKLDRVYFAGLTKKNLPRGKWRFLTQKEIIRLKSGFWR
ncbi:pseudouridine synthase [Marinilabiliaceae bacterium JC017]|nr:pseudouridine synthase [Marinilabiliaceae bacterium JC017]